MPHAGRLWKEDWDQARANLDKWWNQQGLALWVTAPKDPPWEELPDPGPSVSLEQQWYDPVWRTQRFAHGLSRAYFGAESFPMLGTWSGAGDLAAFLGSPVEMSSATIWFNPCITDPDTHPPLTCDPNNAIFQKVLALVDEATQQSRGRYFVSLPDLVENIDILSSLRGSETLLYDMIERPEWVERRVEEINQAFFEVFDLFYAKVKDAHGGNTFIFNIWGPGKTCKVQCDASAMFSPDMFRRFVVPPLRDQCRWLDYSLYHLDGETALQHLDILLNEVPELNAIEWTPMLCSLGEGGGHPKWYDLYRRILKAGKSVQAVSVQYDQVIPLLDAVGGKGMFITTGAPNEEAARTLEDRVKAYR